MRSQTHRIRTNGLTHFVRDDGDVGAPVAVLLHGFPDSSEVWSALIAPLLAGGYRILAPDMRGFGETEMAARVGDYDIETGPVGDVLGVLDHLGIARAHLVGHDFGATVAWALAARRRRRFISLTAASVGHKRAFLGAGVEQKRRSAYMLVHLLPAACEWLYRRQDWALLRKHWPPEGDIEEAIRRLARPGRLTAGLNWYRANFSLARMLSSPRRATGDEEIVRIPTLGVWPSADRYLAEDQMTGSQKFVAAPWRYERLDGVGHWLQLEAPAQLAALLLGHWRRHCDD